jgi:hypothetical protein
MINVCSSSTERLRPAITYTLLTGQCTSLEAQSFCATCAQFRAHTLPERMLLSMRASDFAKTHLYQEPNAIAAQARWHNPPHSPAGKSHVQKPTNWCHIKSNKTKALFCASMLYTAILVMSSLSKDVCDCWLYPAIFKSEL